MPRHPVCLLKYLCHFVYEKPLQVLPPLWLYLGNMIQVDFLQIILNPVRFLFCVFPVSFVQPYIQCKPKIPYSFHLGCQHCLANALVLISVFPLVRENSPALGTNHIFFSVFCLTSWTQVCLFFNPYLNLFMFFAFHCVIYSLKHNYGRL